MLLMLLLHLPPLLPSLLPPLLPAAMGRIRIPWVQWRAQ
jgi:hypothetical protein